jgi:hypothetical protein
MTTEAALHEGAVCTLQEEEQDIELIPAGTQVILTGQNGAYWYCYGMVNGQKRSLLICADNLKPVPN